MTSIIKVDQIQTPSGTVPTAADLGLNVSGSVLQTVQTEHSVSNTAALTRIDTSSGTFSDLLTRTITTKSDNTIIRVMCDVIAYNSSDLRGRGQVLRDSTVIVFDPYAWHQPPSAMGRWRVDFFDQPNVTAGTTLTYKVQGNSFNGTMRYLYSDGGGTTASFLTLQEIAQ